MVENIVDNDFTSFSFWRKIFFIFIFFAITPLTLIVTVVSLILITNSNQNQIINNKFQSAKVLSAYTENHPSIASVVIEGDYREKVIENFFKDYKSPLYQYSKHIVTTSDNLGLDWKLIPAISMKESGGCRVIPEGSHNCWGWGIHSKGTLMFDSFEEAIETVAIGLKSNYIDKGYDTVDKIMEKYAHPDSTTWADGVYYYMNQMN